MSDKQQDLDKEYENSFLESRTITLWGEVDDDLAASVIAQLLFLEKKDPTKDIRIVINSPGGSVYAGLGIRDAMDLVKPDVSTIVIGLAASMAADIFVAGAKGKRFMSSRSTLMMHQVSSGTSGTVAEAENDVGEMKRLNDLLSRDIVKASTLTLAQFKKKSSKDWYINAEEAVKHGFADKVLTRSLKELK